jgi:glutaredoxin 3
MADNATTVTLYSAPWCSFCRMAKNYLGSKDVKFKIVDVDQDHMAAHYIMSKTGQAGIPVLEIGDDVILGFDRPRIDESLAKYKLA